jgi:SAM-dependent methyltransferase
MLNAAGLLRQVAATGYRFTTVTPLTHQRVLARRGREPGATLRDIFGWNLPFEARTVPPELLAAMEHAGVVARTGSLLRSTVRIASLGDDLFLHSAYPTVEENAVFFGPDTSRFARFIGHALAPRHTQHARKPQQPPLRVLDVGCGSGAGGIAVARALAAMGIAATVVMNDINPLALQYTAANAEVAGVPVTLAQGDALSAVDGAFDLIVSNPPYLDDAAQRAYRHGGTRLGRALSARERLPKWLICVPLVLQWLWLGVRLPQPHAAVGRQPDHGGRAGRRGQARLLPRHGARRACRPRPACALVADGRADAAALRERGRRRGLDFPLVAKPDQGLCGYGVRRIDDMGSLQDYLAGFPRGETVVLQPTCRRRARPASSMPATRKTAAAASSAWPCANFRLRDRRRARAPSAKLLPHAGARAAVIASPRHRCSRPGLACRARRVVRLSTVGSTRVGGLYLDGGALATPALTAAIDRVARDMPEFHFGRFDVRYASPAAGARRPASPSWKSTAPAPRPSRPGTRPPACARASHHLRQAAPAVRDCRRATGAPVRGRSACGLARLNRRQQRLNGRYPASN